MKKRRELDALVNNGKIGRRKPTKNGKHELLRSETDSSEVEFQVPAQKSAVIRKSGFSRTRKRCHICGTCISVCAFFMITLCLLACGGLIWLQVGLRKELDDLRVKLISVETGNQDTPEALQSVHSSIKDITTKLGGLKDVQAKEEDLGKQVKTLNADVGKLSKSVSEASKITNLPEQVQQIKQNVATMGSTVSTIQDQVKTFQTFKDEYVKDHKDMKDSIEKMQAQMSSLRSGTSNTSTTPPASPDNAAVADLKMRVTNLANALKTRMDTMETALRMAQRSTRRLGNKTAALERKVNAEGMNKNTATGQSNVGLDLDEIAVQVAEKVKLNLTAECASQVEMNTFVDHVALQLGNMSDRVQNVEDQVGHFKPPSIPSNSPTNVNDNGTLTDLANVRSDLLELQQQMNELNESKVDKEAAVIPVTESRGNVSESMVKELVSTAIAAYMMQDKEEEKQYEVSIKALNVTMASVLSGFEKQGSSMASIVSRQDDFGHRIWKLEQKAGNNQDNSEMPHRPLHMTGIDNKADLRSYFYIWDGDDDGKVSYNDIKTHMGIHTPSEERMKNYDYNSDGSYSEFELSSAMGFVEYTTPAPVDANATTSAPDFLQVPSIQNKEDLRLNFYRWDRDGDSFVRYDDLPMFLGSNTPRKHLFTPWDTNGDGQYSLAELIAAFGYPPDTTVAPTTPALPTTVTTPEPTTPPLVKIEYKGINTESTLEAMFTYWDKNRDGFASYNELYEALGHAVPSPKFLAPYDEDNDGLFTQHDLKMAFGFIPVPDSVALGRTQVPLSDLTHKETTKRSVRSKYSALRKALQQRLSDHSRK